MKKITIATFNIQNFNMRDNKNLEELIKLIKEYDIDVLCLQEVIKKDVFYLREHLTDYNVIGKYRYGENFFTKNIKILSKYNEANPIITKNKVLEKKNYHLPWLPKKLSDLKEFKTFTPRILNEVTLSINSNYITVFNTHLDRRVLDIRKRQLNKIIHHIKGSYPCFLTGDFNMNMSQRDFKKFVKKMEKINLKRVEINGRTLKKYKKDLAIDHIFIPENYKILDKKVIDNSISDHYLVLITVEYE